MPATITESRTWERVSVVADHYGIARATLHRRIKDGTIRARKRGPNPREVCVEDVESYLSERPVGPTEGPYEAIRSAVERALAQTPPLPPEMKSELADLLKRGGAK